MQPRISIITLGVKNLARSIEFYRKTLGWKSDAKKDDDIAFFNLKG